MIYSRYQSISEQVPTEVQILPPDLTQLRSQGLPGLDRFHRYQKPAELLAGLVDEYAFISLYLIAAESTPASRPAGSSPWMPRHEIPSKCWKH